LFWTDDTATGLWQEAVSNKRSRGDRSLQASMLFDVAVISMQLACSDRC